MAPPFITTRFHLFFIGIRGVAFFFSAISTQAPNKEATKRSGEVAENEDHCIESEDDFITPSQVSSKSSQGLSSFIGMWSGRNCKSGRSFFVAY